MFFILYGNRVKDKRPENSTRKGNERQPSRAMSGEAGDDSNHICSEQERRGKLPDFWYDLTNAEICIRWHFLDHLVGQERRGKLPEFWYDLTNSDI